MRQILFALCLLSFLPALAPAAGAPDVPFDQEIHEPRPLAEGAANDVRAVAVDAKGTAWAATRAGAFRLGAGDSAWTPALPEQPPGPAFAVECDSGGVAWIGAWDGLSHVEPGGAPMKISGIADAVAVVMPLPAGGALAFGPAGAWRVDQAGVAKALAIDFARGARAAALHASELWIGSDLELRRCELDDAGIPKLAEAIPIKADPAGHAISALAIERGGTLWAGGMGGFSAYRNGRRDKLFTPGSGLPNVEVRALAVAPDGRLWIATALGVARLAGEDWSLRHGRRWLLSDDARDVAFGPDGAAWIATGAGVSVIHNMPMTLEQKAARYLEICYARHIREPGLVEKCTLEKPGDVASWKPRDDDNDGQYTAMYLAMESYRYAATRDPAARDRARAAFRALKFLQTVTGTDGFVARTVIPADWKEMADPNEEISDAEWARRQVDDPRSKRVERRWRPSADGKWLWKGDTSSDEITGHFYGYLLYHELAADENDKREVAEHVARVMDHIIDNGYTLRDIDGEHTRWGVWSPEKLNRDPLWSPERGVNSVEILSYLRASHRITGEARYQKEYLRLAREEGYAENARAAKTVNPAVRTHIDDELLGLAWPGLFLPGDEPDLVAKYREGFAAWRESNKMEQSPWHNFTYAAFGAGADPTIEDSLFFLRDASLDLVRWTMDNSRREDMRVTRLPEYEHVQTSRVPPSSERGIFRWDDNPWIATQGDGGQTESDGVFWLLPYWMGRYYGYIEAPKAR